ncbi:MAG: TIM barrel protein [Tannerella sp.]|jgi:sialate O-acetylesterase|nr:TIM barrel protein [Tannerella sp.]
MQKKFTNSILASIIACISLTTVTMFTTASAAKPDSKIGGVQIGTITYSFRDLPDQSLEATLNYAVDAGLSSVELMGGQVEAYADIPRQGQREWRTSVSMEKFEAIRKLFDAKGVRIDILKLGDPWWSDGEIDYAFNVCRILGARGITTEISEDAAKRLAPFAEKHHLLAIFHNHGQPGDPNFSFDRVLAAGPSVMLNFDAGHYFGATGLNPCDLITRLHDRIASIHMKDKTAKDANPKDANRPWGWGHTPVAEMLQLLKREKWPITVDIELEYGIPQGSNPVLEVAKCLAYCRRALADVRLPQYISDNMIFQREAPVKIWGWAPTGEAVTVSINGQSQKATADKDGIWNVSLKPLPVGGPYLLSIKGKQDSYTFKNILSGDIWVCGGQSNMEMPLAGWGKVNNYEREIEASAYSQIRLLSVPHQVAGRPQRDAIMSGWQECNPLTSPEFSAIGYFFGRELFYKLDIPIGLIHSNWGGTGVEMWTTGETMKTVSQYDSLMAEVSKSDFADRVGKVITNPNQYPSMLYNAMIAPLTAYPVKGAIWYQGEHNAGMAYLYRTLFPNMINDWRRVWNQPEMPFYFVQLANFMSPSNQPGNSAWAELREAQHLTLKLPNTGEAVAIDIGDAKDIHPKNKQDVAHRLALNALSKTYGKEEVEYSGPEYKSMKIDGNKIILTFEHVAQGLTARNQYGYLHGFSIAGDDKRFVWAKAYIVGNTVVVSSDNVSSPVAVRYGWADNPDDVNLYNSVGLPASPFRTDNWQITTQK